MYNRILVKEVLRLKEYFKVITITGPRQSGKTTLCKMVFPDYDYINLEDETTVSELELNKKEFLVNHRKGLVIDEVQKMPEILSAIQIVVDEHPDTAFVITGSNNLLLMQRVSQSLAGRTAVLTLLPFSIAELTDENKSVGLYNIMLKLRSMSP